MNNDFGESTALSADGRVAIVGALGVNLSQGAAYVYVRQRSGWRLAQELQAGDGATFSTRGDIALIGAWLANNDTGAAYVFTNPRPPQW